MLLKCLITTAEIHWELNSSTFLSLSRVLRVSFGIRSQDSLPIGDIQQYQPASSGITDDDVNRVTRCLPLDLLDIGRPSFCR